MLELDALDDCFVVGDYFPQPDWPKIYDRFESEDHDELHRYWSDVAWIWLNKVAQHLGGGYQVRSSSNFVLLSPYQQARQGRMLDLLEHQRERIVSVIGEREQGYGLHTVMLFEDHRHFYEYLQAFGPEGEEAGAGGVFIGGAYGHIVTHDVPMWNLEPILVHELTHNLLWPSELPLWLEEGLCMSLEVAIGGGYHQPTDRKKAERRREFWSEHGLQPFWDGSGFKCPKAQEWTYELARQLVGVLAEAHRDLSRFLNEAHWSDAGKAAAHSCLGVDLAKVVEGLLGPGDWEPRPLEVEPAEYDD